MSRVELVHWNPRRRPRAGEGWRGLLPLRVDNFGDLLGPLVVRRLLQLAGADERRALRPVRLVSVGSVMRLARTDDVIWGTGVNGKSLSEPLPARALDVRAVRGPRTRQVLLQQGISAPEVYGDPGLLVGALWSREELRADRPSTAVLVVPNLHDRRRPVPRGTSVLDPTSHLGECLGRIAASELVVGSSLHALVVAESLGIPARLVRPGVEPLFKYDDYYAGTGRDRWEAAEDVTRAIAMGGAPTPHLDPQRLVGAFPWDLWGVGPPRPADRLLADQDEPSDDRPRRAG